MEPDQLEDLARIRDIGGAGLANVVGRLDALKPLPLRPEELRRATADALGGDDVGASSLLRLLLSFYDRIRRREATPAQVVKALRDAIEKADPRWAAAELKKWDQVAPAIEALLKAPAIRAVAKAIDLAYEHANVLLRSRIITDVRPVFDESATNIDGAVVTHTLRLCYIDDDGRHQGLSAAVDASDIKAMIDECQRALKKGKVARERIGKAAGITTIISGEPDAESS